MTNKENFLDYIFEINSDLNWTISSSGEVIVEMKNKGFTNMIAQRFFKKPAVSHIHLPGMGSFIFGCIDGKRTVYEIGALLKDEYGENIWDDPASAEKYRAELEELVKENLNENYVVLSTCRNLGIPTQGSEINEYVDGQLKEIRDSFDSRKDYKKWLDEHWMTEHYLRFSIAISYLESAIYYTLLDNDLYQYRHDNIDEFLDYVEFGGKYVRVVHVYIKNEDGDDFASNLAKAQQVSDELQAITDPDERRTKMSEFIGSAINEDLYSVSTDGYYFTRGEMDEDYENAAFDLDIGDVSNPVVCSGGNFVLMRLPLEEEYIIKNAQKLLNNYHSVALGIYEDQFRPDCIVHFNEYGSGIDLVALQ